jgi:c-di-AMP phosphodiesterase-like protein
MNATAFKQIEITQHLSLLTEQQLEQINQYLKTLFVPVSENNQSLKGIWKNKGFEKIDEVAELKQIREELNQSILQRVI